MKFFSRGGFGCEQKGTDSLNFETAQEIAGAIFIFGC